MIKKLLINNNEYKFGHRTFITSESNSKGKTTLIRSILFALGLIQKDTFVDGTRIKNINVVMDITIKNKLYTFDRNRNTLYIKHDGELIKEFNTRDNKYIDEILDWFDIAMGYHGKIIKTILFSNYIDQQYGNHVVNRGRTGFLPNKMRFNLENLIVALDGDYKAKKDMEREMQRLNEFKKNIDYISSYAEIKSNQISLNIFNDNKEAMNLSSLIHKENRLKKRRKYIESKKKSLNDYILKFLDLNLVYKTNENKYEKITLENIQEAKEINLDLLNSEIKRIENDITNLNVQIENSRQTLKSSGFKVEMVEAELLSRRIKQSKNIEVDDEKYKDLIKVKNELEGEINNQVKKMKLNFYDKIESSLIKYLTMFSIKNSSLQEFIDSIKIKDYTFINESSTWTSYVGAVRFAISTSLKFALSDLLLAEGIVFPIIIDKFIHEELDDDMMSVYKDIVLNRKEQVIIANIADPFDEADMEPFNKYTNSVNKDIVSDDDIDLFTTND